MTSGLLVSLLLLLLIVGLIAGLSQKQKKCKRRVRKLATHFHSVQKIQMKGDREYLWRLRGTYYDKVFEVYAKKASRNRRGVLIVQLIRPTLTADDLFLELRQKTWLNLAYSLFINHRIIFSDKDLDRRVLFFTNDSCFVYGWTLYEELKRVTLEAFPGNTKGLIRLQENNLFYWERYWFRGEKDIQRICRQITLLSDLTDLIQSRRWSKIRPSFQENFQATEEDQEPQCANIEPR